MVEVQQTKVVAGVTILNRPMAAPILVQQSKPPADSIAL